MSVTHMLRFSMVAAVVMACSSDSTSPTLRGFVYSAASAQCGTAGGPAVAVYLAPNPMEAIGPSAPYVRVYVPVGPSQLTAHMWPIASNAEAAAWFYPDVSTSEIAESGYMIVNSVDSDNTINGSLDLFFPSAGHIKSEFHAKWRPNNVLCI